MIELGKKQKLLVVKTVDFGIYLGEDRNAPQNERVLLPNRYRKEPKQVMRSRYSSTKILRTD